MRILGNLITEANRFKFEGDGENPELWVKKGKNRRMRQRNSGEQPETAIITDGAGRDYDKNKMKSLIDTQLDNDIRVVDIDFDDSDNFRVKVEADIGEVGEILDKANEGIGHMCNVLNYDYDVPFEYEEISDDVFSIVVPFFDK